MKRIAPFDISHRFLAEVDSYLKTGVKTLTCRDVHDMYFGLFEKLKDYRGTSTGFTGFSEFLVFRFLLNLLRGFRPRDLTQDTKEFIRGTFRIGQSVTPQSGLKIRPDILIEKDQTTIGAVEIKVYVGSQVVEEAVRCLERLRNTNPENFCALLLIFHCPKSSRNVSRSIHGQLKVIAEKNRSWFRYVVLGNSNERFAQVLDRNLKLKRITA